VSAKSSTFTLQSPYREIAEVENLERCGPIRGDVRTKKIFDVLKQIAEFIPGTSPTS